MEMIGRGALDTPLSRGMTIDASIEPGLQLNLFHGRKTGYACAAHRGPPLDARQRPYPRAVWRVRAECRTGCNHFNGAWLAAEARRISADAVATGEPAARRPR